MATLPWASLQEASDIVRAAGIADPNETIRRSVSAALIVRPGAAPLPNSEHPAPRVRVISQRTPVGMDWLQAPTLNFEKSEILCRSFMDGTQERFEHPRRLHPARIELWREDVDRLWPAKTPPPTTAGRRGQKQKYEWDVGEASMRKMLDERGDPTDPKNATPGWDSKSSIAAALVDCLTPRDGQDGPDMETARPYARKILKKWQQDQSG